MKFAFDSHLHLLPIQHICFSAYISFLSRNWIEESKAIVSAPDYLAKDILKNADVILNLLTAVEHKPADALCLLEDDLCGKFGAVPLMNNAGITAGETAYDYLVISPLVMDFELPDIQSTVYYTQLPKHSMEKHAADILEGIRGYRLKRPDGKLIVRPYLGINPHYRTAEQLEHILHTYFKNWSPFADDALQTWKKIPKLRVKSDKPYANAFAGIKLYPPLNFDPFPETALEREKLDILYSFCQTHGIPIITHCDDQGFRMIPQETAFIYTSPERWEKVLKVYPDLYLDIAHFGQQYTWGIKLRQETKWREKIIELMLAYPHVYSDLSFNGVNTGVWAQTERLIADLPADDAECCASRLLFGTDWPLCLMKTGSAADYWHGFSDAAVPESFKQLLISKNPANFHFREKK